MSQLGIDGMRAAGAEFLAVARSFGDTEWRTASAAAGWTVHDVVSHVGCLLELLQASVNGAEAPDLGIEALNEAMVAERRDWEPARTLDNVQKQLDQALEAFAPLQDEPTASVEIPMLDLGVHPLHAIADMFTFDITTHLRYDSAVDGDRRVAEDFLDALNLI